MIDIQEAARKHCTRFINGREKVFMFTPEALQAFAAEVSKRPAPCEHRCEAQAASGAVRRMLLDLSDAKGKLEKSADLLGVMMTPEK